MEYVNEIFNEFLNKNNIERYSCYTDKGAVFAEQFSRPIRNLLEKPVFLVGKASWKIELQSVIKQYNTTIHSSTKITPIQATRKANAKKSFSILNYTQ